MEVAPPREGLAAAARCRYGLRGRFALMLCCLLAACVSLAQAQVPVLQPPTGQPPPAPAPQIQGGPALNLPADATLMEKLAKPGDLSLRSTTLSDALFTISQTWNVNIVIGDEVQGQVNGVFKQAPLREILDTILLSNGCSYRLVGQSLVVMKLKDVGDVNPLFETTTIPVRNARPDELIPAIKLLSSPMGKAQAIPSARSLLVIDFPDRVQMIRNYVQKIDAETLQAGGQEMSDSGRMQAAYFALQYVKPAALKEPITSLLSKEGKVTMMEGDSRLVVLDYGPQLELIRRAIEQLDQPRTQVRITALIYDLSNEDLEQLGINWNSVAKARDGNTAFTIDSVTAVATPAGLPQGTITLMNLSKNFDLTGVLDLLQNCKSSRLLADPYVAVLDNEPAKIEIVTEIPYQQLTQTSQGGNIGTTAFREAGVKLVVTPRIADDGTIRMECNPIFSRLTGYTPGDNPQPIIDRREALTNVRVNNGQTFVIGGLRQRTDINEHTGIPGLQNIKFLHIGKLFQHRSTDQKESELVVFITPVIIGPAEPLNLREQAACQTGNCKLDEVPPGEGCNGDCRQQYPPYAEGHQREEIRTPPGQQVRPLPPPPSQPPQNQPPQGPLPQLRGQPQTDAAAKRAPANNAPAPQAAQQQPPPGQAAVYMARQPQQNPPPQQQPSDPPAGQRQTIRRLPSVDYAPPPTWR